MEAAKMLKFYELCKSRSCKCDKVKVLKCCNISRSSDQLNFFNIYFCDYIFFN